MCPVQENQCVEPWSRDGPRWGDEQEDARSLGKMDFETSQCTAMESGSLGVESLRNGGCWGAADVDQAGEDESH